MSVTIILPYLLLQNGINKDKDTIFASAKWYKNGGK
jgi:hypothetical protein